MRPVQGPPDELAQVELLQDLCHAFASTAESSEAIRSVLRWTRMALGPGTVMTVRLAVPDPGGRLRVVGSTGPRSDVGRRRSAKRRVAFVTLVPQVIRLPRPRTSVVAFFPLVSRGRSEGVLEVIAPSRVAEERWPIVQAVADQAAAVLAGIRRHEEQAGRAVMFEEIAGLAHELIRCHSPTAAVGGLLRYCSKSLRLPAAAWVSEGARAPLVLVGCRRISGRRREELVETMAVLSRPRGGSGSEQAVKGFGRMLGTEHIGVIDSGGALVLVGGDVAHLRPVFDRLAALLRDVLDHLEVVSTAERRNEELDRGLAWTAHEVRGPLLATRAVIARVLEDPASEERDGMLARALQEVDRLSARIDSLLRWSVGAGVLRRRTLDLVRLVREAVESCRLETGEAQVRVTARGRIAVRAEASQLAGAVAELVRNALRHSGSSPPVEVTVRRVGDQAVVSVRDYGPGVAPEDREAIFDPFVRGGGNGRRSSGGGLGLFIARRVVDAHDGDVWLESADDGSVFHLRLPVADERRAPSRSS